MKIYKIIIDKIRVLWYHKMIEFAHFSKRNLKLYEKSFFSAVVSYNIYTSVSYRMLDRAGGKGDTHSRFVEG